MLGGIVNRLLDLLDGILASIVYNPLSGPSATTYGELADKQSKLREWAGGDDRSGAEQSEDGTEDFDARMRRFRRSRSEPREQ